MEDRFESMEDMQSSMKEMLQSIQNSLNKNDDSNSRSNLTEKQSCKTASSSDSVLIAENSGENFLQLSSGLNFTLPKIELHSFICWRSS